MPTRVDKACLNGARLLLPRHSLCSWRLPSAHPPPCPGEARPLPRACNLQRPQRPCTRMPPHLRQRVRVRAPRPGELRQRLSRPLLLQKKRRPFACGPSFLRRRNLILRIFVRLRRVREVRHRDGNRSRLPLPSTSRAPRPHLQGSRDRPPLRRPKPRDRHPQHPCPHRHCLRPRESPLHRRRRRPSSSRSAQRRARDERRASRRFPSKSRLRPRADS